MSTVLYTAHATNTKGGRQGHVESDDGILKYDLATPGAPNAPAGSTTPEQLFAAAYASCFGSAIEAMGRRAGLAVEAAKIHAHVSLHKAEVKGFFVSTVLDIEIPGLTQAQIEDLIREGHKICPFSKLTRGESEVTLKANGQTVG